MVRLFAAGCLAAAMASLSGCAETATAATAVEATKMAADVMGSIPAWVQQAADAFQVQNNVEWGKPERIIVTDTLYVLMYPTSSAQLRANKGVPRMIVIHRTDQQQSL